MRVLLHPSFRNTFNRILVRGFILVLLLITITIWLGNSGYDALGIAGVGASLAGLAVVMGFCFYKIRNNPCPTCNRTTKTSKLISPQNYSSICEVCEIEWDLGVTYNLATS